MIARVLWNPLSEAPLTIRQVGALYYPLAMSWLFMAIEGPIGVKIISLVGQGRPVEEVWTAALNALIAIALFLESPVIDLLSTSTTLCNNRQAYRIISKFALLMMGVCAVAHALVVFTPLYGIVIERFFQGKENAFALQVSKELWLPLVVMLPWSPAIGWRRYKQGILIRHGRTKLIGRGTAVRFLAMAAIGFSLAAWTPLSGILDAALSLVGGVIAESIFIHFAAANVVNEDLAAASDEGPELTLGKLMAFHLPLTATTTMQLGAGILISKALAASIDHESSWPAYQVALSFMWMFRAVVYAMPEIIITLYARPGALRVLSRFAGVIAGSMSALILLLGTFGIDLWFFRDVLAKSPEISEVAHQVFLFSALIPAAVGLQCYSRGILTALHVTKPRMVGIALGLGTLAGVMALCVSMKWSGAVVSSAGPTLAALVEGAFLYWAMRRARDRSILGAPTSL